jgi:calcineurin-like phosphoesterase family protein
VIVRGKSGLRLAGAAWAVVALALGAGAPEAFAEPRVTLTPASGLPGTSVSLSGSGFAAKKRIVVKTGRRVLAIARTSSRGGFFGSAKLSSRAHGRVRIITTAVKHRVVNVFRVSRAPQFLEARELALRSTTTLRSKPYRSSVGTRVSLSGAHLPRNRLVKVTLGAVRVANARSGRSGSFATTFTVPSLQQGSYQLTARAGSKRLRLPFSVTVDPLVAAAGDIACDTEDPEFNGGLGVPDACHQKQTSDLVLSLHPDAVLAVGDTQYEAATPADYRGSYDPTWGRFKSITRPVLGNHEYGHKSGAGYFSYFGPLAGSPPGGYYSFDLGTWHLIALDTNCSKIACGPGSPQEQWLRSDLAAHPNRCVLAFWHQPLFTSGQEGPEPLTSAFFDALYRAKADLLLTGHNHDYERFAPQTSAGVLDPVTGIREFVVGTGGRDLQSFKKSIAPNTEALNADTFGVLALRLHPSSYDWKFVPEAGRTYSDSGSQACH